MAKGMNLHVIVVSPERTLYDAEAERVAVPGEKGRFEILKDHAPIISSLQKGELVVSGSQQLNLEIAGGFVEVCRNEVSLCVEVVR